MGSSCKCRRGRGSRRFVMPSAPIESRSRCAGRSPFVLVPVVDAAFREIVQRQLQPHAIARENTDMVLSQTPRCISGNDSPVLQCHAIAAIRQDFVYDAIQFQQLFLCQIDISDNCVVQWDRNRAMHPDGDVRSHRPGRVRGDASPGRVSRHAMQGAVPMLILMPMRITAA